MFVKNFSDKHFVYRKILEARNMTTLSREIPLWKLKITQEEYEDLKSTLRAHPYNPELFQEEAALCYAEWWRRDYNGGIPSKEEVAEGLGLPYYYGVGDDLFNAARAALKKHRFTFIHSLKGTEYFRTLLNQGGLPVNYIKNNEGNLDNFTRFLMGLIRELTTINYNWVEGDISIIRSFNCISYLSKAFQNDNIYDVAMQIAHAIIQDDSSLLPYDDTDKALSDLTRSLKNEFIRAKKVHKAPPLSLSWKLRIQENNKAYLFVNLDAIKNISSDSIPGLNTSTCYAFDIFVAGNLVGKFVRKSINRDAEGNICNATYTRISIGVTNEILWKGESVVEVKIRCDNDDRLFITVAGCYPPNFEHPQVFQMLEDNVYSNCNTAKSEHNIAIFTSHWKRPQSQIISIDNVDYYYEFFAKVLTLNNSVTDEEITLTNTITSYKAEFSGVYLPWIEKSNYKLISKFPLIRVYDKDKNSVTNSKIQYRIRNNSTNKIWHNLSSSCVLPVGLVDIKVEFPDGKQQIETFYAVSDLKFESNNSNVFSTEIICTCSPLLRPEIEQAEHLDIKKLNLNTWKLSKEKNSNICPVTCAFRIYKENTPTLKISIPIPFDGTSITDVEGNILPNDKIISLSNLAHYIVVCHGTGKRQVDVSYYTERDRIVSQQKHLKSNLISGLVSLSDYYDLIQRMFNLYGTNTFDRSSSVLLNFSGKRINIRRFILETSILDGNIIIFDNTGNSANNFCYQGDLYAIPVDEICSSEEFNPIKLERKRQDENIFNFPSDFNYKDVIVFSGPEVKRRVIPKYYNREAEDFSKDYRSSHSRNITNEWFKQLENENVVFGEHWKKLCRSYELCSQYNLPFTTFNGLKAIARSPKLLTKFILAIWMQQLQDVLYQDIERFEQEMAISLHWISINVWQECIIEFIDSLEDPMRNMILQKMQQFVDILQNIFNTTLSSDVASEFASFIVQQGMIDKTQPFMKADISNYCMKIHGISDTNSDLPYANFNLQNQYYPRINMNESYRVMIESAMCAAENTCNINNSINLFSKEGKEHARTINFYRKYFKENYSNIFIKTIKLLSNK